MKLPQSKSFLITATAYLALSVGLLGQTAPAPSTAPGTTEEAVKLDPFNVSADSDVGFVAASSLAGGRMATALKDTPVAYSVITKEFLDAFNVTDAIQAAEWSTNADQNETDMGSRMYGYDPSTYVRQRGIKMGLPTKNFFTIAMTSDAYNLDRVDFARGPNSVLFGAGGVAGTMNSMTKQAEPAKTITELQLKVGSFDMYRMTLDVNRPITEKFAVRMNAVYHDSGTWRDNEFIEKRGITVAAKYVVSPKFSIRAEFEYKKQLDGQVNTSMLDYASAWDGRYTVSYLPNNEPTTVLTPAQIAEYGFNAARLPQKFVTNPGWGNTFINMQNRYDSKGAAQNNNATLSNRVNGVPIRTVGMTINRASWADANDGMPADRWTRTLAGSPYFQLPEREDTFLWTDRSLPMGIARGTDSSVAFNYTPFRDLFIEVAGSHNEAKRFGENTQNRGMINAQLDFARNLPDGSPNPGFLKHYKDEFSYRTHKDYTLEQLRAQIVYKKDLRFGRLQFSGVGGWTSNETFAWSRSMLLPLTSLAPDARSWTDVASYSEYGTWVRYYINDGSPRIWKDWSGVPAVTYNPLTGVTQSVKPIWVLDNRKPDNNYVSTQISRFGQFAGNLDLFKNRLVLIGAFRRDLTNVKTLQIYEPGAMPAGWDGSYQMYRPPAPADYWDMTFVTKNAAGQVTNPNPAPAITRPRARATAGVIGDRANVALAQYANDRFRDDYSLPDFNKGVNTHTYGAVLNVTRWLGVYGNRSTTFNFSQPSQRVDGTIVPPTASEGKDYGFRITLPGNRLAISVGRFDSFQDGATLRAGTGTNTIGDVGPVGDTSATGRNVRGFKNVPTDTYSTRTDSTKGYEFEMTANLTPAWRVILNAGYTMALQEKAQLDIIQFYKDNDAIMRQVLTDAGVIIDANNDAQINPAVDNPALINQTKVQAAIASWNQIQDVTLPNLISAKPRENGGNIKWKGNVATDYRFRSGPLRGLRVGLGAQYRGGQAIAYKASDTIRDPNNPNGTLPDPAGGPDVVLYGRGYTKAVASMSYTVRLKESGRRVVPKTITFDLNIDNLLNWHPEIYGSINDIVQTGNTFFRPRVGEDITSPARRTVPGAFGYLAPRNYTFSAKMNY
jgi:outer membrane receptor protein involved in Fe transport